MHSVHLHMRAKKYRHIVRVVFAADTEVLRTIGHFLVRKGPYYKAEIFDPSTALIASLEDGKSGWIDRNGAQW